MVPSSQILDRQFCVSRPVLSEGKLSFHNDIRTISCCISKDVPKNNKYAFCSKYLRIASITKMESHWDVDFLKSHSRSGHSLGTNQERCLEQNIFTLTFTGTYAFNWWLCATPNKYYPRFRCIGLHIT